MAAPVRTASEYLTQAILWLNDNENKSPLLTVCACWLLAAKVRERGEKDFTAATDGVNVWINPTWFASMSVKDRAFVFAHEAEHGILRHLPQLRCLLGDSIKSTVGQLSNIAQDGWINHDLGKAFGENGNAYVPAIGGVFVNGKRGDGKPWFNDVDAFDPDEHDWYWLYQRVNRAGDKSAGKGGFGEGSDLEQPGEGGAEGDAAEIEAMAEQMASRAVAQAAARIQQMQSGGQGAGGGWLGRLLQSAAEPVYDWRSELWQAATSRLPQEHSYRRINKSYASIGACVGTISRPGIGPIVVAMDTSGSITEEMLAQPVAEVGAIMRDIRPEKIYQLWADAEIANVQILEPDMPLSPEPRGGGGTDFAPVFKWVEENTEGDVCMLIYFTDLYADYSHLVEPEYPVIWAALPGSNPNPPPFGKVIKIGWK